MELGVVDRPELEQPWSSQALLVWRLFGQILKWIGGITIVLSVMTAVYQLNELLDKERQRSYAVSELLRAADQAGQCDLS
ncbi:MAG: hypothetical protein P8075_17905 [Deltaproteobacteria bacterium]|jgi:hypothetical protein